ncbi:AraC family transcriptional regulator [Neobacillus mesonae]|nr:AraC family transcriptional regulator [Neobacillus mesonae]
MMVADHDNLNSKIQKAKKATVHHSSVSEHFRGSFPLFVNRYNEGFDLREHDHEYIEIVYVMSGEGYHYVGNQVERTSKGSIYVLPVGTSHILRPRDAFQKNGLVVYNLCIRSEFILTLQNWLSPYNTSIELCSVFLSEPGSYIVMKDKTLRFGNVFEQLYREFEQMKPGYEASMFSSLLQLMVQITREIEQASDHESEAKWSRSKRAEMSKIIDYVNQHITEPLTIERLAAEAGLSLRHCIRLFQQQTGMGFSEYLQHKRIELASELLLETDQKIVNIAKITGYRDIAHFRQVFRKIMGTTPNQHRKSGK